MNTTDSSDMDRTQLGQGGREPSATNPSGMDGMQVGQDGYAPAATDLGGMDGMQTSEDGRAPVAINPSGMDRMQVAQDGCEPSATDPSGMGNVPAPADTNHPAPTDLGDMDRLIAARLHGAVLEQPAVPIVASAITARVARAHRARWVAGGVLGAAAAAAVLFAVVTLGAPVPLPAAPGAAPSGTHRSGIVLDPGPTDAPHKVVVYIDYACPACKAFYESQGTTLYRSDQLGIISLEYRLVTFLDPMNQGSSQRAGIAAACADTVGKFDAYQRVIFKNQPPEGSPLSDAQLRSAFADEAGIKGDALTSFQKCYDDKATKAFVQQMNDAAINAGVTGVPAVAVDGTLTTDPEAALRALIGPYVVPVSGDPTPPASQPKTPVREPSVITVEPTPMAITPTHIATPSTPIVTTPTPSK